MADHSDSHNDLSGEVHGAVVQAGRIDRVVVTGAAPAARLTPRLLPPAIRDFAGRSTDLAAMDTLLPADDDTDSTTVIATVDGAPGVGKTTLAVQWAHRVQHRFPDGTLFANLRGYGPSAPLDPLVVLAGFLRVLGVAPDAIPGELDAQSGMYRSLLAGRRVLIVLDNAASPQQVRPLLPGSPGCLVLVTSRSSMSGLIIAEAASQLTLDLFTPTDAQDLVRRIIGAPRATAEPTAVSSLIALCARLPLALRIACTRIAARRALTVADAVDDLTDGEDRLAELSARGDEHSAVDTVFDWSYSQLPRDLARTFRLLGVHPGGEFGVPAIAAVTGMTQHLSYRHMESLADLHLVEPAGRRRYRVHDLLHAYAAHRAATDEPETARVEALTQVVTWYAHTALVADRLVFPGLPTVPVSVVAVPPAVELADRDQALAWLNGEVTTMMTALRTAVDHELLGPAMALAGTARFLTLRERSWLVTQEQAQSLGLRAARACGDVGVESFLLASQGDTLSRLGRLSEAEVAMSQELALAQRSGDGDRQRVALLGLGYVRMQQARWVDARVYYRRALPLARHSGDARSEAVVECNLSRIAANLGQFEVALAHATRERVLRHTAGDQVGEAWAVHDEAVAWQGLGDHERALDLAAAAIAQYEALTGTGRYRALVLCTAATSHEYQGRPTLARECLTRARELFTEVGDPRAEAVSRRLAAVGAGNTDLSGEG